MIPLFRETDKFWYMYYVTAPNSTATRKLIGQGKVSRMLFDTGASASLIGTNDYTRQDPAARERNRLEHIYNEGRELDLKLCALEERFKAHAFSFAKNMAAVRASIRGELTTE